MKHTVSGSKSWPRACALAWMIRRPRMGVASAARLLAMAEWIEARERVARGALAGATLSWGLGLAARALGWTGSSPLDMARVGLVRAREQEAWQRAQVEAQTLQHSAARAPSSPRRRL